MRELKISFPEIYDYKQSDGVEIQFDAALQRAHYSIKPDDDLETFSQRLNDEKLDVQFFFDLSATQYIGLEQLAALILLGSYCRRITGQFVRSRFPKETRILDRFLYPWHFFEFFSDWGISLTPTKEPFTPTEIYPSIPLTRIATYSDVQSTARSLKKPRIERVLRETFRFDNDQHNRLVDTIISEVCDNIPFHSLSDGVVAVQMHMPNPQVDTPPDYKPYIDILVCDSGIGILQSLRKKHPQRYWDKSAARALRDVLEGKVPQLADRMRGGLSRVRNAVRDFEGVLRIKTPFGLALAYKRNAPIYRLRRHFFPGTHVLMKVPGATFAKQGR